MHRAALDESGGPPGHGNDWLMIAPGCDFGPEALVLPGVGQQFALPGRPNVVDGIADGFIPVLVRETSFGE